VSFIHPEWVNGRRIWMDGPMHDLIHRIQHGDPVKGWEGDPRLALFWNGSDERFELWRCEEDEEYRLVARAEPRMALDERIIDALIGMDNHRRTVGLADQILAANKAIDAERERRTREWVGEDIGPRLRHAVMKEL
jgi:hypothetical protein